MKHVSAYSQILVRTGAERGYLLSREKLRSLAETKSLKDLTASLKGSPYENTLRAFPEPSLENLQRAFTEELTRIYAKTINFSPKELQSFLKEYVSHLEIENLKTLLRARNARLPYDTLTAMPYLAIEDIFERRELFIQAAKADDVKGSIRLFQNTLYAHALSEALPQFEETKSTRFFDLALDRAYYERLLDSAKKLSKRQSRIVMPVLGPRLDVFNIVAVIRSKFLGYPQQWADNAVTSQFYRLSPNDMHALTLIESPTSALTVVRQTTYRKFLVPQETIEETLTSFEKAVRKHSMKQLDETRIRDPLSISTPLSIMMKKEAEVENLTAISSGIEHGWKPEEITSTLI